MKSPLFGMDEALEPGLVGGVLDRQLGADQPVRLLDAHRIHRADAERLQAEILARRHERVEDVVLVFDRVVQLPAELADEVDPQRRGRRQADDDLLARQPGEGGAREVGIAHPLQQRA